MTKRRFPARNGARERNPRGLMRLAMLALLSGCGAPDGEAAPPERWTLRSGSPLASLLPASGDTAVVLVYDPSQCFSCDAQLSRWVSLGRERGWPVRLVLTRNPSQGERDQLRLYRLEPDGVLKGAASRLKTPRVYRFAGSALVDSAVGDAAQHVMLQRAFAPAAGPSFRTSNAPFSETGPSTTSQENTR